MKVIQSSDYRIYFDDVRIDPYVKNWSCGCGLYASEAVASITMYRTEKLENWKGYLTQVRVFGLNMFNGKFDIMFEGELMERSFSDQRSNPGEITFMCKGFYHWLDIPIPMIISQDEQFNQIQRFKYEAQNINVDAIETFKTEAATVLKDKNVAEVIDALFEMLNSGYYLYDDSSFSWANIKRRIKVMGDVLPNFRNAGYLDVFTFMQHTTIQSFYVYLNTILTQMMFEFYQDRDGALRIKNPSWSDQIMKSHIIDESIVQNTSGFNNWEQEPTRVLVIGGEMDATKYNTEANGAGSVMMVPMGLYIGLPGEGEYFSRNIQLETQAYGDSAGEDYSGGGGAFFEDLNGNYTITSKFHEDRGYAHLGVDLGMKSGTPLHSQGVDGEVVTSAFSKTAGNWIIIKQKIDGTEYHFVYMHLSERKVKVGDKVSSGQTIGLSGSTGNSTGPHLHFEVWKGGPRKAGGKEINPLEFTKKMAKELKGGGAEGGNYASGNDQVTQVVNMDLAFTDSVSGADLNKWLNKKSKKSSKMYNRGQDFYNAAKAYGINPLYLAAHAAIESSWGSSKIVKDKNNYFGIGAYDGSAYASAYSYKSPLEGIKGGAKFIRQDFYDAGQRTLYQMRHSKSGKHDYASDPNWDKGIAKTMISSGLLNKTSSSASSSVNTTPYAPTGGYLVSPNTSVVRKGTALGSVPAAKQKTPNLLKPTEPKATVYPPTGTTQYPIPNVNYKKYIQSKPNGVHPSMISSIIAAASNWKEKYMKDNRYGLMGLTKEYIQVRLGNSIAKAYTPEDNIYHGTLLFSEAMKRFKKVTAAIATVYCGSMTPVENALKAANSSDFSKVRTQFKDAAGKRDDKPAGFVDEVIRNYIAVHGGDYIKGDPNIPLPGKNDLGFGTWEPPEADDTQIEDYSMYYRPIMSDEERLYKVKLEVFEQNLIRYDMNQQSDDSTVMSADDLVERFAKYMMQLYRAQSHGVTVNLSTCLPHLRPGWNVWLEPTRRDVVFYLTGVTHQGSFGQGATTSIKGAFVRSPKSYDDIEDNIFVGETHSKASDYGEVIKKSEMDKFRKDLKAIHDGKDEIVSDAKSVPKLKDMYSNNRVVIGGYSTMWSSSMSQFVIEDNLKSLYVDAPEVVKTRKNELKTIIEESKDFFLSNLLRQPY